MSNSAKNGVIAVLVAAVIGGGIYYFTRKKSGQSVAGLEGKYKELIDTAKAYGVSNLQVREYDGVLYIDGTVVSEAVKDQLWLIYEKIDPDFRGGDLVMNLSVQGAGHSQVSMLPGQVINDQNLWIFSTI